MARRSENNALTILRCRECETGVAGITTAVSLEHNADGTHAFVYPRPDHRTVSIWASVRAALDHIRTVEFYLGYLPEKPRTGWVENDESVRMQLADARAVLGDLANALADGDVS